MPTHAPLALLPIALLGATLALSTPDAERSRPERIETHDNERAAGRLRDRVLTLDLDARLGAWYPHGSRGRHAVVPAFAEGRRQPQIPSPMIRVPAGTEVVATVRNSLDDTLTVHGLASRPAPPGEPPVVLAPGEAREIRFRLEAPGTYYYWATTMGRAFAPRTKEDAQLGGAIVVDAPGAARPRDRVLVIGQWSDTTPSELHRDIDMQRMLLVVNGRSWPHTTRLEYAVGDTIRWRLINTSAGVHPMHLHGFHFTVDARGDGWRDSTYRAEDRTFAVTERMLPGHTFAMSWVPVRAGNWLFHCHVTSHFSPRGPLGAKVDETDAARHAVHARSHAEASMAGLVVGVTVSDRRSGTGQHAEPTPRTRVRMLVRDVTGASGSEALFNVSLGSGDLLRIVHDTLRVGPTLELERGVPAAITVVNRTRVPTSIHWHGLELDSYFDGVPGFSGAGRRLSPLIAPGDSFEVRITPPRAGTFIYHTHADEIEQQPAGLSGPLIVVEPGTRWQPPTDIPVVISSPRADADERRAVLINGSLGPAPLMLRAGVAYRLRLINITTGRPALSVELGRGGEVLAWRVLAKDGADLPGHLASPSPARRPISVGETVDVEFTPGSSGEYVLEVKTALGARLNALPVLVQPADGPGSGAGGGPARGVH